MHEKKYCRDHNKNISYYGDILTRKIQYHGERFIMERISIKKLTRRENIMERFLARNKS